MGKRLKVIHVVTRLNVGGVSRSVIASASAEIARGNECVVIAGRLFDGEQDMSYLAGDLSVPVIQIPTLCREPSGRDLITVFILYFHLVRLRPDVVHTHTAKAGTLGRIAASIYCLISLDFMLQAKKRCRVIHTFHGNVFQGYFGTLSSAVIVRAERLLATLLTDEIVVLSRSQLRELQRYRVGTLSQYRISPNQFVPEGFRFSNEKRRKHRDLLGISSDEIVVAFVGRLVEVKNPGLFVDAAKTIIGDAQNWKMRFLIIGDGVLRSRLEMLAGSSLGGDLLFLGQREDIEELYSAMDMVCVTSRNEGNPYVVMESIAAECPVIATDVGDIGRMLGGRGSESNSVEVREYGLLLSDFEESTLVAAIKFVAKGLQTRHNCSRFPCSGTPGRSVLRAAS